jgi:hypothetical protein
MPTDTRTHVHAVADQQPPVQLAAIQTLQKYLPDPLSMKPALAPIDDEPFPESCYRPTRAIERTDDQSTASVR